MLETHTHTLFIWKNKLHLTIARKRNRWNNSQLLVRKKVLHGTHYFVFIVVVSLSIFFLIQICSFIFRGDGGTGVPLPRLPVSKTRMNTIQSNKTVCFFLRSKSIPTSLSILRFVSFLFLSVSSHSTYNNKYGGNYQTLKMFYLQQFSLFYPHPLSFSLYLFISSFFAHSCRSCMCALDQISRCGFCLQ